MVVATTMQSNSIIAWPAWLNAFDFKHNFPQAVAYAPRKWAGLGMVHHYHEQGLHGMFTIVQQIKSKSEVGKIVMIGVETFWMIVGTEEYPFVQPSRCVSLIYEEGDWFSFIHDFMHGFNLSMVLPMP